MQNDVCAEFDTRRLFSHLSPKGGKFLCAHLRVVIFNISVLVDLVPDESF